MLCTIVRYRTDQIPWIFICSPQDGKITLSHLAVNKVWIISIVKIFIMEILQKYRSILKSNDQFSISCTSSDNYCKSFTMVLKWNDFLHSSRILINPIISNHVFRTYDLIHTIIWQVYPHMYTRSIAEIGFSDDHENYKFCLFI